jgi:hypothetical protein
MPDQVRHDKSGEAVIAGLTRNPAVMVPDQVRHDKSGEAVIAGLTRNPESWMPDQVRHDKSGEAVIAGHFDKLRTGLTRNPCLLSDYLGISFIHCSIRSGTAAPVNPRTQVAPSR